MGVGVIVNVGIGIDVAVGNGVSVGDGVLVGSDVMVGSGNGVELEIGDGIGLFCDSTLLQATKQNRSIMTTAICEYFRLTTIPQHLELEHYHAGYSKSSDCINDGNNIGSPSIFPNNLGSPLCVNSTILSWVTPR